MFSWTIQIPSWVRQKHEFELVGGRVEGNCAQVGQLAGLAANLR